MLVKLLFDHDLIFITSRGNSWFISIWCLYVIDRDTSYTSVRSDVSQSDLSILSECGCGCVKTVVGSLPNLELGSMNSRSTAHILMIISDITAMWCHHLVFKYHAIETTRFFIIWLEVNGTAPPPAHVARNVFSCKGTAKLLHLSSVCLWSKLNFFLFSPLSLAFICILKNLHAFTCLYIHLLVFTCKYLHLHTFTCIYMCLHAFACFYMLIHAYTCFESWAAPKTSS